MCHLDIYLYRVPSGFKECWFAVTVKADKQKIYPAESSRGNQLQTANFKPLGRLKYGQGGPLVAPIANQNIRFVRSRKKTTEVTTDNSVLYLAGNISLYISMSTCRGKNIFSSWTQRLHSYFTYAVGDVVHAFTQASHRRIADTRSRICAKKRALSHKLQPTPTQSMTYSSADVINFPCRCSSQCSRHWTGLPSCTKL